MPFEIVPPAREAPRRKNLKAHSFRLLIDAYLDRLGLADHPNYARLHHHMVTGVSRAAQTLTTIEPYLPKPWAECQALELGCAAAPASIALKLRGCRQVIGIDHSRHFFGLSLAQAQVQIYGIQAFLIEGDIQQLPFANDSFHLCICDWVIEHVQDRGRLIAEVFRVLRFGGLFYISSHNRLHPKEPHSGLWGANWLPKNLAARYVKHRGQSIPGHRWDVHNPLPVLLRYRLKRAGFRIAASWNFFPGMGVLPTLLREAFTGTFYLVAQKPREQF